LSSAPAAAESAVTDCSGMFRVTKLAEIKLSNAGLGHLAIEHYNNFRVPDLYAVLILVFVLAVGANGLMARLMPRH
jgi:ABC-type nitrate/sulfonate/bicarbonate transport system permease component